MNLHARPLRPSRLLALALALPLAAMLASCAGVRTSKTSWRTGIDGFDWGMGCVDVKEKLEAMQRESGPCVQTMRACLKVGAIECADFQFTHEDGILVAIRRSWEMEDPPEGAKAMILTERPMADRLQFARKYYAELFRRHGAPMEESGWSASVADLESGKVQLLARWKVSATTLVEVSDAGVAYEPLTR